MIYSIVIGHLLGHYYQVISEAEMKIIFSILNILNNDSVTQ